MRIPSHPWRVAERWQEGGLQRQHPAAPGNTRKGGLSVFNGSRRRKALAVVCWSVVLALACVSLATPGGKVAAQTRELSFANGFPATHVQIVETAIPFAKAL